jgi:hypothetical protein
VVVDDNPVTRGYIKTATHLLVVEPVDAGVSEGSDEQ